MLSKSGNTADAAAIQLYTGAAGARNPTPKIVPKTSMPTELERIDMSNVNNKILPTSKLLLFLEAQPHGERQNNESMLLLYSSKRRQVYLREYRGMVSTCLVKGTCPPET